MKTKNTKPKGIDPLIKALPEINKTAESISEIFESWGDNHEISEDEIKIIETWLKDAKCDKTRKIARCAVKCIYNNWVICDSEK